MTTSNEFPVSPGPVWSMPPQGNAFVTVSDAQPPAATESAAVVTDALLNSAQTAEILGITQNNLRQMVHKKKILPVSREGRRSMFSRAEVEDLAKRRGK